MKKIISIIKKVPWYGYVFAASTIVLQVLVYFITAKINGARLGTFTPVNVKIPWIDDSIPFVVNSSIFYFASYPFWFFGALIASLGGKHRIVNLSIGYATCMLIGALFFIFMPTYYDRVGEGVYDAVKEPGALNGLLSFIYENDGGKVGNNLFPSFHCLVSMWWCLSAHFTKKIRSGWKMFTIIATIIICVCTLTTKQHYFADVISGVGIALVVFIIVMLINPARWIIKKDE